ncbi:MAG: tetratricopeptide repeat protein [Tissierellia bacterium]|jgi:tetratricopeptide (TPR) repeat protein|nr:tetratricopeptide repeat protein [Tissierellia bacterium]
MTLFNKTLEDLSFLELRRELKLGDIILPKGLNLPLYTTVLEKKIKRGELDFGTEEILEGILSLYGADKDFKDKDIYRPFVKTLQPLLGYLYERRDNPLKSLIMALGLIHLDLEEEGLFLFAAERCNDLIKEGYDYSDLALELLDKEKPSWPVGYHRGYLYYNKERYEEALRSWRGILDEELPTEIRDEVFSMMVLAEKKKEYLLGRELLFKERYEEARQVFKSLLIDFPHWYDLHFYYGLSLRFLEHHSEALGVFYGLLHTKRDDIHLYNELALCHLFLQEAEEARVQLIEGLKLADHPDLRLNLAISLFELGDKKAALTEINRAKGLAPEDELIDQWQDYIERG